MTEEQQAVARRHQDWHAERFGYANVEFHHGYIEDLAAAGIADASVDVVVSNCVVNLSPDKERVLAEIFRVLEPGGELYFSDIFADRRLPAALLDDPVLVGECLAGALYTEDFRRLVERSGCLDARTVATSPVSLDDLEIQGKIGFATFTSRTVRAFKLPLEDRCEDYSQVAVYQGSTPSTRTPSTSTTTTASTPANRCWCAATPPTCFLPPATHRTSP
ncbi:methyltransferase domain-containing protein [Streptomyces sp. NPDC052107]|uniref:methyltransferase domain-containing protein n=1 Tax=Streptomyces sp. NPDC052107 TaxID=3155632 RepID=UPI0034181F03